MEEEENEEVKKNIDEVVFVSRAGRRHSTGAMRVIQVIRVFEANSGTFQCECKWKRESDNDKRPRRPGAQSFA